METVKNNSDYVDVDDALPRVGGNLTLYKRLLGRFIEGNNYEALVQALESGDTEEALRQAHSLKGVSANLSLTKIRTISTDFEQLLKDNADFSASLVELKQAFDITTEIISEILA